MLLFVLFYIAASGNETNPGTFERNFNTKDGAQMWRFDGGTQRIAAAGRRSSAARACCNAPVRRIEQTANGVQGRQRRAARSQAKRAIVAIPPTLAGRIDYSPGAARRRATSSPSGSARAR